VRIISSLLRAERIPGCDGRVRTGFGGSGLYEIR
jgi:hypothetical protein